MFYQSFLSAVLHPKKSSLSISNTSLSSWGLLNSLFCPSSSLSDWRYSWISFFSSGVSDFSMSFNSSGEIWMEAHFGITSSHFFGCWLSLLSVSFWLLSWSFLSDSLLSLSFWSCFFSQFLSSFFSSSPFWFSSVFLSSHFLSSSFCFSWSCFFFYESLFWLYYHQYFLLLQIHCLIEISFLRIISIVRSKKYFRKITNSYLKNEIFIIKCECLIKHLKCIIK